MNFVDLVGKLHNKLIQLCARVAQVFILEAQQAIQGTANDLAGGQDTGFIQRGVGDQRHPPLGGVCRIALDPQRLGVVAQHEHLPAAQSASTPPICGLIFSMAKDVMARFV